MDKKTLIIIILTLIIIGFALYFSYIFVSVRAYQRGIIDLITDMNVNAYFPVVMNNTIQNIKLQDLCGG